jgi:DNA-binding NarL/FixJ family response regulator
MAAHAIQYEVAGRGGSPAAVPRILLADDNPEILELIRQMLEGEFVILGGVLDGESVLREAAVLKPDVIILDISMGEPSGILVARRLREAGCPAKLVFLTVHESPEFIGAALGAGASAYVFKSALASDLGAAVEAVCKNEIFISSKD